MTKLEKLRFNRPEVGDLVKIHCKKHRDWPLHRRGRVLYVNGGYIGIIPEGCWWCGEFYDGEFDIVGKSEMDPRYKARWVKRMKELSKKWDRADYAY